MRAIQIDHFGGPEQLHLVDLPDPVVTAGQVLIGIEAAGVNRTDILVRSGETNKPGFYAEQSVVPVRHVVAVPDGGPAIRGRPTDGLALRLVLPAPPAADQGRGNRVAARCDQWGR